MKIMHVIAALLLISSLATPATAHERTNKNAATAPEHEIFEGRDVAAPPWSAACMTDHGPSECGEPMWIYGSSDALARYRSAF